MSSLTLAPPRRARRMPPLGPSRLFRLAHRVALQDAATAADLSLNRAAEIERDEACARPGELARLRAAVELLAAAVAR